MSMPEATMNEDDSTMAREDNVWFSGEFRIVQPVPEPHRLKQASNAHFWRRSFATHAPHSLANVWRRLEVDSRFGSHQFGKAAMHALATDSAKSHGKALPTMLQAWSM